MVTNNEFISIQFLLHMSLKKKMVCFQMSVIYRTLKMQFNMVVTETVDVFSVYTMCTMVCPDVSKECAASVFRVT